MKSYTFVGAMAGVAFLIYAWIEMFITITQLCISIQEYVLRKISSVAIKN